MQNKETANRRKNAVRFCPYRNRMKYNISKKPQKWGFFFWTSVFVSFYLCTKFKALVKYAYDPENK